jgi:hypothetical protein
MQKRYNVNMATRLLTPQRIVNLASDPVSGTSGEIYYNTVTNVLRYHDGTTWVDFTGGGGTWANQLKHLVKNDSGTTLDAGTVVYTSGANGTNILVKKALATTDQFSAQTLGFVETTLGVNATGYVVSSGLVTGIDTSSASAGSAVWLSSTTPGGVVYGLANKPEAPDHLVYLGVVTRSNVNNGEIFVHVSNGWEIEELHDVLITNPSNDQVLTYESATGLWKNKTPTGGGGGGSNVQTDVALSNSWWLGV